MLVWAEVGGGVLAELHRVGVEALLMSLADWGNTVMARKCFWLTRGEKNTILKMQGHKRFFRGLRWSLTPID